MYRPRSRAEITRDRSAVTHGNVNAVPSGMNATASASSGSDVASGIPPSPIASRKIPMRESRGSPSRSTALPSNSTRVNTEIDPMYTKK